MDKALDLMNRMGENINEMDTWEKIILETPIIISEGLIKTYDTSLVINAMSSIFKLRKNGKRPEISLLNILGKDDIYIGDIFLKNGSNGEEEIKIILYKNDDFIKLIERKMEKYGWSLYREEKGSDNRTEFIFEKKFPTHFLTKNLLKYTNKIYHQTTVKLLDKITKQGIIPKTSKSPGFQNEPRIYFWLNVPNDENIINARGVENVINIEINLEKLNKNHIFYIDNRMGDAIYTKEPIPPTAINDIKILNNEK